jgi:tetratricopeptide (TPR) repeat protein
VTIKRNEARLRAAVAAFDAGDPAGAARIAEDVLAGTPDEPRALLLAGMSNIVLGRAERAIAQLERKTTIDPSAADGYVNLGSAYRIAERHDEAIAAFRRALTVDPKNVDAHANLATVLRDSGDVAAAEAAWRAAVALAPGDPRLHKSLGFALRWLGRNDEAESHLTRAVALAPGTAEFRVDRGLHRLSQGAFATGWRDLEARFDYDKSGSVRRSFPQAAWRGEALGGKSIVVWGEQGLGDLILYAHQVRALRAQGARVILDVDPRLVGLFQRSLPGIEVVPLADPPDAAASDPAIDFQVALGSLGLHMPNWPSGLFPAVHWLRTDPTRRSAVAERLGAAARGRPTVGLSWRSQRPREGKPKSTELVSWAPILAERALFVTLQYGDTDAEVAAACAASGADIYTDPHIDRFNDLEGLAALIESLDVVVTTSNVTAHIAGALGKPTLLALPHLPHWYWFPAFEAYASVERFGQETPGDWAPVLDAIAARLRERLA